MAPKELYSHLESVYPQTQYSLCELHELCQGQKKCQVLITTSVLNFDKIKEKFDIQNGYTRNGSFEHKSVDAVCYTDSRFCFVELKGWVRVLEGKQVYYRIDAAMQVENYDLKRKFEDSQYICSNIMGTPNLFLSVPNIFILVTDIAVEEDAMGYIAENLFALAQTTSQWHPYCNQAMVDHLKKQLPSVEKYYICCQNFDAFIRTM